MKPLNDTDVEFELSTGRRLHVDRGSLFGAWCTPSGEEPFTRAEQLEIADYVIDRWTSWKAALTASE